MDCSPWSQVMVIGPSHSQGLHLATSPGRVCEAMYCDRVRKSCLRPLLSRKRLRFPHRGNGFDESRSTFLKGFHHPRFSPCWVETKAAKICVKSSRSISLEYAKWTKERNESKKKRSLTRRTHLSQLYEEELDLLVADHISIIYAISFMRLDQANPVFAPCWVGILDFELIIREMRLLGFYLYE